MTGPGAEVSHALRHRFEILKKLSDAGTHSIYLARHLVKTSGEAATAALVRLMVLSPDLSEDFRQVQLFHLEAAAAARLHHANIGVSAEAEETNGIHFYAAPAYSDKWTLAEHLRLKGWMDADEAAAIGHQIADALEYAHGHDVLHLTLDPEKVLLSQDGSVLVTGFGIDRNKTLAWARLERAHGCAAPYISPEQILKADADQRTDLYLLGLLLYEMITDRKPFETEDSTALRTKQLLHPPPPLIQFRPDISRTLSQLVLGLLGKRPDGRPFGVADFKAALNQCVKSGAIADEECAESRQLFATVNPRPVGVALHEPSPDAGTADAEAEVPTIDLATTAPLLPDTPPPVTEYGLLNLDGQESGEEAYSLGPEYDTDFASLSGSDVEVDSTLAPGPEATETPARKRSDFDLNRYSAGLPEFSSVGFGKAAPGRLAWFVGILLIAVAGIFLATRIASVTSSPAGPVVSDEIAGPQQVAEAVSTQPAAVIPPPTQVDTEAVRDLTAGTGGIVATVESDSTGGKKEVARHPEAKDKDVPPPVAADPVRKSLKAVAPDLSSLGAVPAPEVSLPARLKGDGRNDLQALEPPRPSEQPAIPKIIRKPGDLLQNTATARPKPNYPKGSRSDNARGSVTVEVMIDEEGSVISARPISGPDHLRNAAVSAARGWKWTPTKVERRRARVVGTITFDFKD